MLTFHQLKRIARKDADDSNIQSIIIGLDYASIQTGLHLPHRYIHFAAQVAHESGRFKYDREVWGPTPAQVRYDTRTDLGNTAAADGDGFLYRGRTAMQATGKANYTQFRDWCRQQGFAHVPDFVKNPDLINTDPWEGLFPVFYWVTRKLNTFADRNDIEMITRRINGGLNGFDDRIDCYDTLAMLELDFAPGKDGIYRLQKHAQSKGLLPADTKDKTQADGIIGPKTRAAMHGLLVAKGQSSGVPGPMPETAPAPVIVDRPVEVAVPVPVEVPVPVVPEEADKTLLQRLSGAGAFFAPLLAWLGSTFANLNQTGVFILLGVGLFATAILLWRGEMIAKRAKAILKELESA